MLKRIALLVILLLAAGAAAQEGPALSGVEGIRNFLRVNEKICTGGQPTLEQLAELKAGGIRAVLNLRRPTRRSRAARPALLQHPRRPRRPHRRPGGRVPENHG